MPGLLGKKIGMTSVFSADLQKSWSNSQETLGRVQRFLRRIEFR